jgi:hypothetical protein
MMTRRTGLPDLIEDLRYVLPQRSAMLSIRRHADRFRGRQRLPGILHLFRPVMNSRFLAFSCISR